MKKMFNRENLGDWQPRLFFDIDPFQTFAAKRSPEFSDQSGTRVVEVDAAQELLLLGYAAIRGVSRKWPLTKKSWTERCKQISAVILESAEVFDFDEHVDRSSRRFAVIDWQSFSPGDMEVMLLHDVLLRKGPLGTVGKSEQTTYWCMLCLMHIDRCVNALVDGDAHEAAEHALRASVSFAEARPEVTLAQARRELASAGGIKRHQNDPVQRSKSQAKAIWETHRGLKRIQVINLIRQQVPELLLSERLPKWVDGWNRESRQA